MDSVGLKFYPFSGDLNGLYVDENYLVFKWNGPGKILASAAQRGKAITAHLSSDKAGLRHLKQAVNDFCYYAFWLFDCVMILAQVTKQSVGRLILKCGFDYIGHDDGIDYYARSKTWAQ